MMIISISFDGVNPELTCESIIYDERIISLKYWQELVKKYNSRHWFDVILNIKLIENCAISPPEFQSMWHIPDNTYPNYA